MLSYVFSYKTSVGITNAENFVTVSELFADKKHYCFTSLLLHGSYKQDYNPDAKRAKFCWTSDGPVWTVCQMTWNLIRSSLWMFSALSRTGFVTIRNRGCFTWAACQNVNVPLWAMFCATTVGRLVPLNRLSRHLIVTVFIGWLRANSSSLSESNSGPVVLLHNDKVWRYCC